MLSRTSLQVGSNATPCPVPHPTRSSRGGSGRAKTIFLVVYCWLQATGSLMGRQVATGGVCSLSSTSSCRHRHSPRRGLLPGTRFASLRVDRPAPLSTPFTRCRCRCCCCIRYRYECHENIGTSFFDFTALPPIFERKHRRKWRRRRTGQRDAPICFLGFRRNVLYQISAFQRGWGKGMIDMLHTTGNGGEFLPRRVSFLSSLGVGDCPAKMEIEGPLARGTSPVGLEAEVRHALPLSPTGGLKALWPGG